MTATPTLLCEGFFADTATWSGVPLATVLSMAGPLPDAKRIKMVSADGYQAFLDLDLALAPENFLAYELMGQPVPVLHGFPLRAVIPSETGHFWVKWLVEIVVE
jgi:DMSO/TMAO reductase YedYZ molybdopterin-dependent catalytic subunit